MKRLCLPALIFCTALAFTTPGDGATTPITDDAITEYEVKEYLGDMDRAVKAFNVPAMMALLSGDVRITLIVPGTGGDERITFTKSEYEAYLVAAAPLISGYVYSRSGTVITISPDGRGSTVSYELNETMTMEGHEIRSVTTERLTLERRDGRLVAATLDAIVISSKVDKRMDT